MRRVLLLALAVAACGGTGGKGKTGKNGGKPAGPPPAPGMELAIFAIPHGGPETAYGLVTERRELQLQGGENVVRFDGVPRTIDGASVTFRSFTDPDGAVVRSQGFAWDAASADALLDGQVGSAVVVVTGSGEVRGNLLAFDGAGVTVETDRGAKVVPSAEITAVRLGARPAGFTTTPTLVWRLDARKGGKHLVEVTYQAWRIWWHADHRVLVHGRSGAAETTVDLESLVTLGNGSGKRFDGVKVELVDNEQPADKTQTRPSPPSYRLPGELSLAPDRDVRVALGPPRRGLAARREVRYDPIGGRIPLQAQNIDINYGLGPTFVRGGASEELVFDPGQALPAGRVLVYEARDDGAELVAQAMAARVDDKQPMRVEIGRAAGIVGTRRRIRYHGSPKNKRFSETFEITLRNDGKEDRRALVVDHMYRTPSYEITDASGAHRPMGERAEGFTVNVPAGRRARLVYTVEYRY
jgi:hypothetical protein